MGWPYFMSAVRMHIFFFDEFLTEKKHSFDQHILIF